MDLSSDLFTNIIAAVSLLVSSFISFVYIHDRRQHKYRLMTEYSNQIMDWYAETIEILIRLKHKVINNENNLHEPLAKLSALIERGRFLFPNIDKNDGFGKDKPTAFQGYRNLALDFLVASYNLYNKNNCNEYIDQAEQLHRYFTSIIFEVIRPQENLKKIKSITDKYFVKDEIFEDFISSKGIEPLDFIWKHYT